MEKQVFEMDAYTTRGGETIAPLAVGWEAYGTLNEARDNAILLTHFFSGTSHAAGRYEEEGPAGYWDSIIGPGKPLDTDEYYIIASDTLVNLNAHALNVTTTGPASPHPETGEPWGLATLNANHWQWANQTFMAGHGESLEAGLAAIEAPTLMLYSEDDLVFAAQSVKRTAELIGADGTPVELIPLAGTRGRLDGMVATD